MACSSKIEWTGSTWNPVTGCSRTSEGCANCYAERMALRLQAMGNPKYRKGFEVVLHDDALKTPLRWKVPQIVFVNSMSDLFHRKVPLRFIRAVFDTMQRAERHTFQVLTKRSERLLELSERLEWADNIWMGVSVELRKYSQRLDDLRRTGAKVKFVSFEPLLAPIGRIDLFGIHWVIVGGESGPGARPMKKEWATEIREQCLDAGIPFFFKQWGGVRRKEAGRRLDGRTWDEMPEAGRAARASLFA